MYDLDEDIMMCVIIFILLIFTLFIFIEYIRLKDFKDCYENSFIGKSCGKYINY